MQAICILTFDDYINANIVVQNLQSNGVNAWLQDETVSTMFPIYNLANGGTKLFVNEDEYEQAMAVLNQTNVNRENKTTCPTCQSVNVQMVNNPKSVANFILALVSGSLFNFALKGSQCFYCYTCKKYFD